jgi:hypothetical protein
VFLNCNDPAKGCFESGCRVNSAVCVFGSPSLAQFGGGPNQSHSQQSKRGRFGHRVRVVDNFNPRLQVAVEDTLAPSHEYLVGTTVTETESVPKLNVSGSDETIETVSTRCPMSMFPYQIQSLGLTVNRQQLAESERMVAA